jgi:hypothetical protein
MTVFFGKDVLRVRNEERRAYRREEVDGQWIRHLRGFESHDAF